MVIGEEADAEVESLTAITLRWIPVTVLTVLAVVFEDGGVV